MRFILLAMLSLPAFAVLRDIPAYPIFDSYQYIDLSQASHKLVYDVPNKKVSTFSKLKFHLDKDGRGLLDFRGTISKATLNGKRVSLSTVTSPGNTTKYLAMPELAAGEHTLEVEGSFSRLLSFGAGEVRSAFWMTDLEDRGYLERYLPSSLEYDRAAVNFEVVINGATKKHIVLANGDIQELGENHYQVNYPEHYTPSSIFFHLVPEDGIIREDFEVARLNGEKLPVTVYMTKHGGRRDIANRVSNFSRATKRVLKELQTVLGEFPHESLIVMGTIGGGGMEYAGATTTSMWALKHELIHSYIARSLVPANGNAGWIDEAITMWADDDNFTEARSSSRVTNPNALFQRSKYLRTTAMGAYRTGRRFIRDIAAKLKKEGRGSFVSFLVDLGEKHRFTPYTHEQFWSWATEYFGINPMSYVKHDPTAFVWDIAPEYESNPYHPHVTMSEERSWL